MNKILTVTLFCGVLGALYFHFLHSDENKDDMPSQHTRATEGTNTRHLAVVSDLVNTSQIPDHRVTTSSSSDDDVCSRIFAYAHNDTSKKGSFSLRDVQDCVETERSQEPASADALSNLLVVWTEMDLMGALEATLKLNAAVRQFVLPAVVQKGASIDANRVDNWLASANIERSYDIMQAYYRGRAEIDPLKSLDDILNLSSNGQMAEDDKLALLTSALEQWAEKDALEAMKWLEQEKGEGVDASQFESMEIILMIKLVEQDDRAAEAKIMALKDGPHKELMIRNLAQHLAELDEELAVDWAQSLPDAASRKTAVSAAVRYWTDSGVSAEKVIELILSESNEETRQGITNDAALLLAGRNSQELANIYLQLPQEEHPHVVEKIANSWVNTDHESAAEWVNSLPSGEAKDAAIFSIVTDGLSHFEHPGQALAMANGIFETGVRLQASKTILQDVARRDVDEAYAMLAEITSLSDTEIKSIEQTLPKRNK